MKPALLALFLSALLLIHALIGGTRLLFSLPAYALLGLAAVLAAFLKPAAGPSRPAASCLIGVGLLAAYIMIRAALSPVAYLWWPDFYMVLACVLVYLLVATQLTSTSERTIILAALMVLAAAEILVALHQFSTGDDFMPFGLNRPPSGKRASGFLISPNHLAGFLESVGIMALSCACWSRWRLPWRIIVGYVGISCFVGVAVTGSRGGYLATSACLVTFGLISVAVISMGDRARALRFAVVGVVVIGGCVVGGLYLMKENILLRNRLETLSAQFSGGRLDVRIYNWQATLDQFRAAPLAGTGAGTHLYFGRYFRRVFLQNDPIHAHGDYLELIAEYGVLGGAAMAIFLGTHLVTGVRRLRGLARKEMLPRGEMTHDDVALTIGALSAVAAMIVHSVVDFNMHIPGNALLFAFVFALLAGGGGERTVLAPGMHWARLALPVLGAWMLVAGLPKLPGEYWAEYARKALGRYDLVKAEEYARRAIALEPQNPYTYFYLGEANRAFATSLRLRTLRAPHFRDAIDAFSKSLALFPQDETTWVRLGQSYDGLKDFGPAETAYLTAINLDPNFGVVYAYYAAHLRLRGRLEEAEEQFKKGQALTGQNLSTIIDWALDAPTPATP